MTFDDTLDGDIARRVVPVNHAPPVAPAAPAGRRDGAAKLLRRIMGLTAGRWELIVSVDEHGVRDWSVRPFGKVEQ